MAAAGLTDVGAGDPHPLVLGRGRDHLLEQLAIAPLQLVLSTQGQTRRGDAVGEDIPNALQVLQVRHPRRIRAGRHRRIDRDARESLRREARELVLEAADLTPQLGAGEALVAPQPKHRERVSIEQLRHGPEIECRSRCQMGKRGTG